jgi:hypothetical protein
MIRRMQAMRVSARAAFIVCVLSCLFATQVVTFAQADCSNTPPCNPSGACCAPDVITWSACVGDVNCCQVFNRRYLCSIPPYCLYYCVDRYGATFYPGWSCQEDEGTCGP